MKYAPWSTLLASSSLLDLSPEGSNEQWTEQVQPISRSVISMNSTVLRYSLMDPYSVLQFLRRPLGFVQVWYLRLLQACKNLSTFDLCVLWDCKSLQELDLYNEIELYQQFLHRSIQNSVDEVARVTQERPRTTIGMQKSRIVFRRVFGPLRLLPVPV